MLNYIISGVGLDLLNQAVQVLNRLPEYESIVYKRVIERSLINTEHIVLIASVDDKPIGCCIAFNKYFDGSLFIWYGGILPEYRCLGIAKSMLLNMEEYAQRKMFLSLRIQILNRHREQMFFSLANGFYIMGFDKMDSIEESRIQLIKEL